jgi:hypothetical protein
MSNPTSPTTGLIHENIKVLCAEIAVLALVEGFMRCLQYNNDCGKTGKPCRERERCGCYLEMQRWCKDE